MPLHPNAQTTLLENSPTCGDDLENARLHLPPYRVGAGAGERPVVPGVGGGVTQQTGVAAGGREPGGCHVETLAAVVELPGEVDVGGIGGDVAAHVQLFVEGGADHGHLGVQADWSD